MVATASSQSKGAGNGETLFTSFYYGSAHADRSKGILYISSARVMTGANKTHLNFYLRRYSIELLHL